MSKKSKLEWLNRDLFTSPYCYALCLDEKEFAAEQKRLGIPADKRVPFLKSADSNATTSFFEGSKSAEKCAIVTMHPITKKSGLDVKQVYAILVHEAVHIWRACAESLGENYPAAEQEAYAIQRIAQSLMFSYDEQTKKRRKKK